MAAEADRRFGGIRVVTSDWPIVLAEFPLERVNDLAFHALLDHIETLMGEAARGGEKLFSITDLSQTREITPPGQRQYANEWIARTADLARSACVGSAQVTPSAVMRGIFRALFWLHPTPTPSFFMATRREAMLKGIELLEAGRVLLPARLIAYRDSFSARRAV
jgi:hypothetical protein